MMTTMMMTMMMHYRRSQCTIKTLQVRFPKVNAVCCTGESSCATGIPSICTVRMYHTVVQVQCTGTC